MQFTTPIGSHMNRSSKENTHVEYSIFHVLNFTLC